MFPLPVDQDASVIDIDAISEVCEKFNVEETEVYTALLSGDPHDQLAIAYHLIIDNKRIADEAAKAELKDFYVASSPPPMTLSVEEAFGSSSSKPHIERIIRKCQITFFTTITLSYFSFKCFLNSERERLGSIGSISAHMQVSRSTPVKRAKWHLGIRSQSKPGDIMNEVFRAMKTLNFEWKVVNAYSVRVRRKNTISDRYSKISLQLYQVDYKSYLLDFKSLSDEESTMDASKLLNNFCFSK